MPVASDKALFAVARILARRMAKKHRFMPPWLDWEDFVSFMFLFGRRAAEDHDPELPNAWDFWPYIRKMMCYGFWRLLDKWVYRKSGGKRYPAIFAHHDSREAEEFRRRMFHKLPGLGLSHVDRWYLQRQIDYYATHLTGVEQEVFVRRYLRDQSLAEIGAAMDRTESWASLFVRFNLREALVRLERMWEGLDNTRSTEWESTIQ